MTLLRVISLGISRDWRRVSTASVRPGHGGRSFSGAALLALLFEAASGPNGGSGGARGAGVHRRRHLQLALSIRLGVNAGCGVGRRQSLYGRTNDA